MSIHSTKIFGFAFYDLVISFIVMIGLFVLMKYIHFKNLKLYPFIIAAILVTIPLSITFHILFGVNTRLNYELGLSNAPTT